MKEKLIEINGFEQAAIIEEFGRYAFARIKDGYLANYFEILAVAIDAEGRKSYRVSPGRPGLVEVFQGATPTPRPEAEMRQRWEQVKAEEQKLEEMKLRASIEAKQKAEAAARRAEILREAHALLKNSREELKQIIQEGKTAEKIADNKRVGTLLQRITAAETIINTL